MRMNDHAVLVKDHRIVSNLYISSSVIIFVVCSSFIKPLKA